MIQKLEAWFKSKNISAHTIALAVIAFATAVDTDGQLRNFILGLFEHHPKIGTSIVGLCAIILKYSHSSSAAGKVAVAKEILASPQAPTAAAVDAATIK